MGGTVDYSEKQRVTCWCKLYDPPDANRQSDVMIEKIFGDSVVSLAKKKDENFQEEGKVVDEKPPSEVHSLVSFWRAMVEWLTAENIYSCQSDFITCLPNSPKIEVLQKFQFNYNKDQSAAARQMKDVETPNHPTNVHSCTLLHVSV